ncbi:unnamed protein product [Polarella glacialis]|uniref:Uncharacterized protein n=1 Tax=Polarella glacialis TaxID=89957 RepID=A0A813E3M6_POLGL|nr:unnamed protein product [Polarella glacialis]
MGPPPGSAAVDSGHSGPTWRGTLGFSAKGPVALHTLRAAFRARHLSLEDKQPDAVLEAAYREGVLEILATQGHSQVSAAKAAQFAAAGCEPSTGKVHLPSGAEPRSGRAMTRRRGAFSQQLLAGDQEPQQQQQQPRQQQQQQQQQQPRPHVLRVDRELSNNNSNNYNNSKNNEFSRARALDWDHDSGSEGKDNGDSIQVRQDLQKATQLLRVNSFKRLLEGLNLIGRDIGDIIDVSELSCCLDPPNEVADLECEKALRDCEAALQLDGGLCSAYAALPVLLARGDLAAAALWASRGERAMVEEPGCLESAKWLGDECSFASGLVQGLQEVEAILSTATPTTRRTPATATTTTTAAATTAATAATATTTSSEEALSEVEQVIERLLAMQGPRGRSVPPVVIQQLEDFRSRAQLLRQSLDTPAAAAFSWDAAWGGLSKK